MKKFGLRNHRNHKIRNASNLDEQKFETKNIQTNENSESKDSERKTSESRYSEGQIFGIITNYDNDSATIDLLLRA